MWARVMGAGACSTSGDALSYCVSIALALYDGR